MIGNVEEAWCWCARINVVSDPASPRPSSQNDAHWDLDEARIIKDTVVVDGEVHSVSDHWGVEADFSFDSTRPVRGLVGRLGRLVG